MLYNFFFYQIEDLCVFGWFVLWFMILICNNFTVKWSIASPCFIRPRDKAIFWLRTGMLYIYSTLLSQEGYNNRFILPTMITHNGRFILNFCWKLQYLYFCPQSRGTSINQKQNCQHMLHFFRHNVKTVGLLKISVLLVINDAWFKNKM